MNWSNQFWSAPKKRIPYGSLEYKSCGIFSGFLNKVRTVRKLRKDKEKCLSFLSVQCSETKPKQHAKSRCGRCVIIFNIPPVQFGEKSCTARYLGSLRPLPITLNSSFHRAWLMTKASNIILLQTSERTMSIEKRQTSKSYWNNSTVNMCVVCTAYWHNTKDRKLKYNGAPHWINELCVYIFCYGVCCMNLNEMSKLQITILIQAEPGGRGKWRFNIQLIRSKWSGVREREQFDANTPQIGRIFNEVTISATRARCTYVCICAM